MGRCVVRESSGHRPQPLWDTHRALGVSCLIIASLFAWGPWATPGNLMGWLRGGLWVMWYQLDLWGGRRPRSRWATPVTKQVYVTKSQRRPTSASWVSFLVGDASPVLSHIVSEGAPPTTSVGEGTWKLRGQNLLDVSACIPSFGQF